MKGDAADGRCQATTGGGARCKRPAAHGRACAIRAHREQLGEFTEADAAAASHGTCRARAKSTGKPCRLAAGYKTDHPGFGRCHLHGGMAPGGRKAAQREMAEKAVATYGLSREVDPHEALLEEIYRTAGHIRWLEGVIANMDPEALTWGTAKVTTGGQFGGSEEERAEISVWLQLYHRERRHLVEVCRTAIAAGIAERQVRLAEEQGRLIAQVIRGVLDDLGVGDLPEVPEIVRRHLMVIEGGAA